MLVFALDDTGIQASHRLIPDQCFQEEALPLLAFLGMLFFSFNE